MRNFFLLTTVVCATIHLNAQNIEKYQLQKLFKVDLGFQGLGFTYEPRFGRNNTIDLSIGTGGSYSFYGRGNGFGYDFYPDDPAIYISATPKFYYNRQKRINRGKKTILNSGNYIGLRAKYASAPLTGSYYSNATDAILLNVHWGMQRAIGNHFLFNTHAGVGLGANVPGLDFKSYPALDVKFSYAFGRREGK